MTGAGCPSSDHISSAVYGATSDSITASVSAASRTAASAGPAPESMTFLVADQAPSSARSSTLNLNDSTSPGASARRRCVTRRSDSSPRGQTRPAG